MCARCAGNSEMHIVSNGNAISRAGRRRLAGEVLVVVVVVMVVCAEYSDCARAYVSQTYDGQTADRAWGLRACSLLL